MLPCKHLFHRNINGDFLTNEHWEEFQNMFKESGYDIYISRAKVIEEQYEDLRDVKANQHRQQFQAAQEELREHWFQLKAIFRQTGNPQPLYDLIAQIRTPVQQ